LHARDGAALHLGVEFGSLGMREEYGESTRKIGRVFVFVFVFIGVWGPSFVQRQKAAWIDHRRLVVSFFFELQTSLVVLL
jgi:hypothetical protein